MESVDCLVVGAGVIGLAAARALAARGRDVIVIEAADRIGAGISSRNSEVIHAGLYYPEGSLMGRLCVSGRTALYDFCASRHIPHRKCGKMIVAASPEEIGKLGAIRARAEGNGVGDLVLLDGAEAHALEPDLSCEAALLSPSTGILDSHAYMTALQGELESFGGVVVLETPALRGEVMGDVVAVEVGGVTPIRLRCNLLVNAAGLSATKFARRIKGLDPRLVPQSYLAKGNYFALSGQKAPFSRLIYPAPVPGGLGVHLTFDLAGQARFGPDVEWVETEDYRVDPERASSFYAAIRRYWPGLRDGTLQPSFCGLRPKIAPPGAPAQDFLILGPEDHGGVALVNLFGVESPGLTSSLAIGEHVAALAGRG
ncbi:NAD(P)/FAD-dependent oxidoreductase [Methylocella sp.]|uniref:NAD(P)/FAD-dependent oxidoreductase n=1 Tax=Methylocella sp. TaxID=1978226 RepID=UPI0037830D65